MPFDGATLAFSAEDALDAACAASGVVRIDYDTLERHKAVQLLAHPPGWAYRRRAAVVLAQAAVLAIGVMLFMLLSAHDAGEAGLNCLFGALGRARRADAGGRSSRDSRARAAPQREAA